MSALRRKLSGFARLAWADRLLVAEAALALAAERLTNACVPRRYHAPPSTTAPIRARGAGDSALLERVRTAVQTAARNVPWNATCLPQAMAAQTLLARRGVGSCVHIGVGKDERGKIISHAWLETGGSIVIGDARSAVAIARFE